MGRTTVRLASAFVIAFVVGACADVPSGPDTRLVSGRDGALGVRACTTLPELGALARKVFGHGTSNVNSVLGKLKNLDHHVRRRNREQAVKRAHDIVAFTLDQHRADPTPAPDAVVTRFINLVYCYAGIDIGVNDPSNSHLIFPSDQPQVKYAIDQRAAIAFDANPVSEPTLIEFQQLTGPYPPGGGPLETKLDQYPGFVVITKSSETDAPLAKPAVVGVCAQGVIPEDVRGRLRLGHGKATGFEIAQPGSADFLDCENLTEAPFRVGAGTRLLRGLADLLLPARLEAKRQSAARGGGVGGTVTEFSPFAPVDPVLRAGGGVGGTVTEFMRSSPLMLLDQAASVTMASTEDCTDGITGIAFADVSESCRPFVQVTTRLGTVLADVPVTWTLTVGDGKIAAQAAGECGTYARPVLVTTTDLFGRSSICWRLGGEGAHQVTATPGVGGDAPPGVTFEPTSRVFDATAGIALGRPTVLLKVEGDAQVAPAGAPTPVAPKVLVTDGAGNPVAGITVTWLPEVGSGSVSPSASVTDAKGNASTTWVLGPGENTLRASIDHWISVKVHFRATGTTP